MGKCCSMIVVDCGAAARPEISRNELLKLLRPSVPLEMTPLEMTKWDHKPLKFWLYRPRPTRHDGDCDLSDFLGGQGSMNSLELLNYIIDQREPAGAVRFYLAVGTEDETLTQTSGLSNKTASEAALVEDASLLHRCAHSCKDIVVKRGESGGMEFSGLADVMAECRCLYRWCARFSAQDAAPGEAVPSDGIR
ncbi:hypothetical protein E4U21_005349 [Claviceps maximensis]|nr:hypothetical protein E4U21_005349 [Claviceps maximensis]